MIRACISGLLCIVLFAATGFADIEFYVGSSGSDSNPGTLESPFKSIEKARLAVRAVNRDMTENVVVQLLPGDHYLEKTLTLIQEDSGYNGKSVIYRNYGPTRGQARLIAAKKLTNWQRHSGRIYKTYIGDARFNTLFENGRRCIKARQPNQFYEEKYAGAFWNKMTTAESGDFNNLVYRQSEFDPSGWNINSLEVVSWGGDFHTWETRTMQAISVNAQTRTINVVNKGDKSCESCSDIGTGMRYFLQGQLGFLDTPGEFWLDETAGYLYYMSREYDISRQEIIYPIAQTAVLLDHARNIKLEGITVECSDFVKYFHQYDAIRANGVIQLKYSTDITISDCHVKNSGFSGIFLDYSDRNTISNCWVEQAGTDGINLKNSHFNTVYNCKVHDVGQLNEWASCIIIWPGNSNVVSNCEVYNSPRYGISIRGGYTEKNLVSYCYIHNAGNNSGDTGALHAVAWGSSGNIPNIYEQLLIENTRAHDTMMDIPPNGIFFDAYAGGQTLNNIVVRDWQTESPNSNYVSLCGPYRTYYNVGSILSNCSWLSGFDESKMEYDNIGLASSFPQEYSGLTKFERADYDSNRVIDIHDLTTLARVWLQSDLPGSDLFIDKIINSLDFALFAGLWLANEDPESFGTVSYWKLDTMVSTLLDSKGRNYIGLTGGSISSSNSGVPISNPEMSYKFNGDPVANSASILNLRAFSDYYIQAADILADSFTFEGYFKTSATGLQYLVGDRHQLSGFSGWHLWISGGRLAARVEKNSSSYVDIAGSTNVCDNNWHHFAFVWESRFEQGGIIRIYLDGKLEGVAQGIASIGVNVNRKLSLGVRCIHSDGNFDDTPFNGYMDELRLTKGAIAPEKFLNYLPCVYWELDNDGLCAVGRGRFDLTAVSTLLSGISLADPIGSPEKAIVYDGGNDGPAGNPSSVRFDKLNSKGAFAIDVLNFMAFAKNASFTVEGWFKAISIEPGSAAHLISSWEGTSGWAVRLGESDKLIFEITTPQESKSISSTVAANTKYHFAAVWDGVLQQMRLYINGIQVSQAQGSAAWDTNVYGGVVELAGRNLQVSPTNLYNGTLDEIRFTPKALNPGEFLF